MERNKTRWLSRLLSTSSCPMQQPEISSIAVWSNIRTRQLTDWSQLEGVEGKEMKIKRPSIGIGNVDETFRTKTSGKDDFDARVGLLGMINVILGVRP